MARRNTQDDIAFGSDSFLDIVANIVGILIILIVIAGVRVSQMPALVKSAETNEPPVFAAISPPVEPTQAPVVPNLRPPPPPPPVPTKPASPPEPPAELVQRVELARSQIARLTQVGADLRARLHAESALAEQLRQEVADLKTALNDKQGATEQGRRVIAALQTDLETNQRAIAGLHVELAETEAAQPPPQIMRHKVTPIGRLVVGEQLWFVLEGNRVAVLPGKELTVPVIRDLDWSQSRLLRGTSLNRTYGPVDGFLLKIEAKYISLSQLESWRYSGSRDDVRLLVGGHFEQTDDVVFESISVALEDGSRFLHACRTAGRNATLTFFVYPDSFEIYQHLRAFGHNNSFDVAAKPQLAGRPIGLTLNADSPTIAQ